MQKDFDLLETLLSNRGLRHVLYWLASLAFLSSLSWVIHGDFFLGIVRNLMLLPCKLGAAYFIAYVIIPKLILKRKYLLSILAFVASYYALTVLARTIVVHVWEPVYREPGFEQESLFEILTDLMHLIKHYFFGVYSTAWIFIIVKLLKDQLLDRQKREVIEKEKARAELNFLKAQIHPHFLFNTLNNLYSLTLKKSDKAPEVLMKLSDMLDYMLYQCTEPHVPIQQEIELLHNYIELEKLRYGDRLNFKMEELIDDKNTPISPLILLSLVENAFKHGASGDIGKPKIDIRIQVSNRVLEFDVFNSKPLLKQKDVTDFKKGIGVSNVKRQLDLIYPGQHKLIEEPGIDSHRVFLQIQLSKQEE
jgi:two-component system LytT family sensor kinase